MQVFIAAYASEGGAEAALKDFRAMDREGSIELIDAAVALHSADGKVKIEETADPSGKRWGDLPAARPAEVRKTEAPRVIRGGSGLPAGAGFWG